MKNHFFPMHKAGYISGIVLLLACPAPAQLIINTIAGNGTAGFSGDGGPGIPAQFNSPQGVAVDVHGNVYVADIANNRIRKISPGDTITTFAGSGPAIGDSGAFAGDGGQATDARLNNPWAVAVDATGNVYFSDADNERIRKISPAGIITTIAGNGIAGYSGNGIPATAAEVSNPYGLTIDSAGNVYIADTYNNRVRKIDTTGIITTIAGNGIMGYWGDGSPATDAELYHPYGILVDGVGNVYFADTYNDRVRKVDAAGIITTIAGDSTAGYAGDGGPATDAELHMPFGLAMDAGENLYITEAPNDVLRKVSPSGIISTFAGNTIPGYSGDACATTPIEFNRPISLTIDTSGNLYLSDPGVYRVRKINYNHRPLFSGAYSGAVADCIDTAMSINTQLAATDADAGQTETWSILAAPLHGAAIGAYTTVSTGGLLTPTGLSYMPVSGYTGMDSFSVMVKDCVGATDTATIYINIVAPLAASPITGSDTVCTGYTITLADTATGGVWSATNAAASVATGVVTGATAGIDTINYAVSNARGSAVAMHIIEVENCPAAVGFAAEKEAVNVYPNPGDGTFTLTFPTAINEPAHIIITNMLGEKIKEIVTATNDPLTIQLDVPAGVYFLSAVTEEGTYNAKVVVTK